MIFDLWKMIKNISFVFVFLFILKYSSESMFIYYLRLAFFAYIIYSPISYLFKWRAYKYVFKDNAVHIYEGVFIKQHRSVPLKKVQNIQKKTTIFHRIFAVTSITLETGADGEEASVKFDVISRGEADEIERAIPISMEEVAYAADANVLDDEGTGFERTKTELKRTIHFSPIKRDVIKAVFTSLSFLAFVPIVFSFIYKLDEIFELQADLKGIYHTLSGHWWMIALLVILLMVIAIVYGMISTFIKYGKYEISSDQEQIFIKKGVLAENAFSIRKGNVQAVQITQSLMKRILGLAEVKLISAGSLGEGLSDTNSLYPFLPVNRAYSMVEELLPDFRVDSTLNKLPRKSFIVRMLHIPWFVIIATILILIFKPGLWFLTIIFCLFVYILRMLNYWNTGFKIDDHFIYFKSGSLETDVFITKRDKIIEIAVTRTRLQRMYGLATIQTVNRSKPVHHSEVQDIPTGVADNFYHWYSESDVTVK